MTDFQKYTLSATLPYINKGAVFIIKPQTWVPSSRRGSGNKVSLIVGAL